MSRSRSVITTTVGVAAVGALLAMAGCAPAPQSTPTAQPTPSESATPDPYAGPLDFVGDELDWFLPAAAEIADMLPSVGDVSAPSSSLIAISDGGGPVASPAACNALLAEAALGSVGARTITWTTAARPERDGWLHVLQFADEAAAQARMDQYAQAADQCVEFEYEDASSFVSSSAEGEGGVRAIAGSLTVPRGSDDGWNQYKGYASVGNVIVSFWQPFGGEPDFDTAQAAALLRDRASEARAMLIDELTANPPTPAPTPAAADPSAPWGEWEISAAGVGPVPLGVDVAEAIAAVPGAHVEESDWGGPTRLIAADGSASLLLWADDDDVVSGISVGAANVSGDRTHDGAALPAAGGVRVGDPVSAAIAAFPEGTTSRVVSSGEFFYESASRDGITLRFRADREATDPAAVITGILVEDAKLRTPLNFG
ncbi:sensor domain-containing protein [Microbacterium algeriense]|nr:sensor domain-containing protein [Microbacterium algeriense]